MKRLMGVSVIVGMMAVATAIGNPMLTGRGIFEFASQGHGEGRASFEINVTQEGKRLNGRLLFSAEGIHIDHEPALSSGEGGYPDIVVTAESLNKVEVKGNVATVRTKAMLHQEPVVIRVTLTDSRSKAIADRFLLRCDRPNGVHLFHVEGPLVTGDIDIR